MRKTFRYDLEILAAAESYCGLGMLRRTKPVFS